MRCPKCGNPMEHGHLQPEGYIFWSEAEYKLTQFPGKNDVVLVDAFAVDKPPAWLCRTCKFVLTPYE